MSENAKYALNTFKDLASKKEPQNKKSFALFRAFKPAPTVYLLLDMSLSMQGEKFVQAKNGAASFCHDAIHKGWRVGLVAFHDGADLMCEACKDAKKLTKAMMALEAKGSTNMTRGLRLTGEYLSRLKGSRYLALVTDGYANDADAALKIGNDLKNEGAEILTLGTPDADAEFLSQLASCSELARIVEDEQLAIGMTEIAGYLPYYA